jgi:hypothetical protein
MTQDMLDPTPTGQTDQTETIPVFPPQGYEP